MNKMVNEPYMPYKLPRYSRLWVSPETELPPVFGKVENDLTGRFLHVLMKKQPFFGHEEGLLF